MLQSERSSLTQRMEHATSPSSGMARVLAAFTFPKGTKMSAVDEHRKPQYLGGRLEFHEAFELRAMTPGDVPESARSSGMAAAELLSYALMVISAQGVDVVLEKAEAQ
jgi:hypothetical protein